MQTEMQQTEPTVAVDMYRVSKSVDAIATIFSYRCRFFFCRFSQNNLSYIDQPLV